MAARHTRKLSYGAQRLRRDLHAIGVTASVGGLMMWDTPLHSLRARPGFTPKHSVNRAPGGQSTPFCSFKNIFRLETA